MKQKLAIPSLANINISLIVLTLCMTVTTYHLIKLYKPSLINTDTAQYLSVARNFISGNGFTTSIIYYNEQHLTGKVPAPQTVFPNGYPFLISLVMMFGVSPAYSAFLICLLCFNLIGLEIYLIAKKLSFSQIFSVFAIGFWFFLIVNWSLVLSNLSEMSFIFFTTTSAYFLLVSESINKKYYVFFSSIAAALSFTIRYAGIFFIFSIILYFILKLYKKQEIEIR